MLFIFVCSLKPHSSVLPRINNAINRGHTGKIGLERRGRGTTRRGRREAGRGMQVGRVRGMRVEQVRGMQAWEEHGRVQPRRSGQCPRRSPRRRTHSPVAKKCTLLFFEKL